jgi:hypothetical protein
VTNIDPNAENIERFAALARKYCAIVESVTSLDRPQLLDQVYEILAGLIDAGVHLPGTDHGANGIDDEASEDPHGAEVVAMSDDAWRELYHRLQHKLGDADLYWMVFDATKDREAIRGSLADDIADVYRDLKDGLAVMAAGSISEAAWHWRLHFDSHWGLHAMNALKAIHDARNL